MGWPELVTLGDSLLENATTKQIAAIKLKIDTRKWIIGKRLPKVYGDAPTALHVNTTTTNFLVVTEQRQREIQERTRRLSRRRRLSTEVSTAPPFARACDSWLQNMLHYQGVV